MDGDGRLVARFDLADPGARVAVEFDSYRHHFGRQAWRRDQARHNRATALGWLVFHATEHDLRGPPAEAFRRRRRSGPAQAGGVRVAATLSAASSAWRTQAAMPRPR